MTTAVQVPLHSFGLSMGDTMTRAHHAWGMAGQDVYSPRPASSSTASGIYAYSSPPHEHGGGGDEEKREGRGLSSPAGNPVSAASASVSASVSASTFASSPSQLPPPLLPQNRVQLPGPSSLFASASTAAAAAAAAMLSSPSASSASPPDLAPTPLPMPSLPMSHHLPLSLPPPPLHLPAGPAGLPTAQPLLPPPPPPPPPSSFSPHASATAMYSQTAASYATPSPVGQTPPPLSLPYASAGTAAATAALTLATAGLRRSSDPHLSPATQSSASSDRSPHYRSREPSFPYYQQQKLPSIMAEQTLLGSGACRRLPALSISPQAEAKQIPITSLLSDVASQPKTEPAAQTPPMPPPPPSLQLQRTSQEQSHSSYPPHAYPLHQSPQHHQHLQQPNHYYPQPPPPSCTRHVPAYSAAYQSSSPVYQKMSLQALPASSPQYDDRITAAAAAVNAGTHPAPPAATAIVPTPIAAKPMALPSSPSPTCEYHIRVRQQPVAARSCGFGERDRRVIDPPPIVQLTLRDPSSTAEECRAWLRHQFTVLHCSIWNETGEQDNSAMPEDYRQQRRLMGTLVSSPFVGLDEHGEEGCFFCFPDLSCRTPGAFRLKFALVVLDPRTMCAGGSSPVRAVVMSDVFTVYNAKDFPGMQASTALTKRLKQQGCLIAIKKGNEKSEKSEKSEKRKAAVHERDESDDEEDEDGGRGRAGSGSGSRGVGPAAGKGRKRARRG